VKVLLHQWRHGTQDGLICLILHLILETPKPLEFVMSQSKLISIEEIFQDINRQMLETNHTLNLGQLLKMALELKRYLW
jgi:hypothetical protein